MIRKLLFLAILVALLLLTASVSRAEEQRHRIGSIDGSKTVTVKRNGDVRHLGPGDPLEPGDEIQTQRGVTATIQGPSDAIIVLGQNSRLTIEDSPVAVQAVKIDEGTLRGIVGKNWKPVPKKRIRLFVRTRSAVLGVRGTDFVINSEVASEKTEFYSLEGTVEVAKTEEILETGKGVPIKSGEFTEATPKEIAPPKNFDRKLFSEEMKQTQPGLEVPPEEPKREPAEKTVEEPLPPFLQLTSFQLYGHHFIVRDTGFETGGWGVSWNPSIRLYSHWLRLRGHLGYFSVNERYPFFGELKGLDLRALISVTAFRRFVLEFGPTVQSWRTGGSAKGSSLSLAWQFKEPLFGILDRIFVSTGEVGPPSYFPTPNGRVQEDRVGVGIKF